MAEPTYDEFVKPVAIAYIGNKEIKRDTIARSGAVWRGFGDVQTVDARAATQLLRFPTVYIRADELDEFKKNLEEQTQQDAAITEDTASGGEPASTEPESEFDPARIAEIQNIIVNLDPENKEHFFGNGSPKKKAIDVLLPDEFEASKEEVAFAFAQMQD